MKIAPLNPGMLVSNPLLNPSPRRRADEGPGQPAQSRSQSHARHNEETPPVSPAKSGNDADRAYARVAKVSEPSYALQNKIRNYQHVAGLNDTESMLSAGIDIRV